MTITQEMCNVDLETQKEKEKEKEKEDFYIYVNAVIIPLGQNPNNKITAIITHRVIPSNIGIFIFRSVLTSGSSNNMIFNMYR